MAFLNDYKKHFKKLRIDKSIHINLHNQFSRVIHTKNEEMQKRIVDQIQTPTNHIKISIGNFLINPAPSNSLVKVEVILMDNRCNLYENLFFTSESNMQHRLICFESEAKALVGKTAFKESKCMKLPVMDSTKALKEFTMFFFVKIAQHADIDNLDRQQRRQPALDQFIYDPNNFQFKTKYFAQMPLYDSKSKTILRDCSSQRLELYDFDHKMFLDMIKRQKNMPEVQKVQTWMFKLSTNAALTVDIKLHSNIFSNINVLGYLFELNNPQKMSLQNMDLMLKKLRKLQHD